MKLVQVHEKDKDKDKDKEKEKEEEEELSVERRLNRDLGLAPLATKSGE